VLLVSFTLVNLQDKGLNPVTLILRAAAPCGWVYCDLLCIFILSLGTCLSLCNILGIFSVARGVEAVCKGKIWFVDEGRGGVVFHSAHI
jgi:hypothetical protein